MLEDELKWYTNEHVTSFRGVVGLQTHSCHNRPRQRHEDCHCNLRNLVLNPRMSYHSRGCRCKAPAGSAPCRVEREGDGMKECGCLRVREEEGNGNIRLEGARICTRPGKIYIADGVMRGDG